MFVSNRLVFPHPRMSACTPDNHLLGQRVQGETVGRHEPDGARGG